MLPQRRARHASPRIQRNRAVAAGIALVAVVVVALVVTVGTRGDGGARINAAAVATTTTSDRAADARPTTTLVDAAGAPATAPATTGASQLRGRRGSGQAVTLAFGGDVHFEGQIRTRLVSDPASVMAGVAPLLRSADLAVVNLETAVTGRGTKPPSKQYGFRAPPTAFAALRAGGVDVATMANNHGMDFGRDGLEDSLTAATSAAFPLVGIGRSAAEAYKPFISEVKGQRIAVIGATQVLDDELRSAWTATDSQPGLASAKDVDRITAAVRAARAEADTVVVYLHWGTEGQSCPNEAQPVLARILAEAGADVIVGGHAHRLEAAGRMGSAFVAYGLGNFVFYSDSGPGTDTGVLTLTVTGRDVDDYQWTPAHLVGQLPRPLSGAAATQALASWEALRGCAGLTK